MSGKLFDNLPHGDEVRQETRPHPIKILRILLMLGERRFATLIPWRALTSDCLDNETLDRVDNEWPDVMLLLGPGRVVTKQYEGTGGLGGSGWLEFLDVGEDALMAFTIAFHGLLNERAAQIEEPLYLMRYGYPPPDLPEPTAQVEFPLHRPPPQRSPLWRTPEDDFDPPSGEQEEQT